MICLEVENQFLKFWSDFNEMFSGIYMFLFINYMLSVVLIIAFRDIEHISDQTLVYKPIRHAEHTDGQLTFVLLSHTYCKVAHFYV